MSKTYNLVCPDTGKAIWVGQRDYLYSGKSSITKLAKWLHEHEGKKILFVEDQHPTLDDIDFENWVGMGDDS